MQKITYRCADVMSHLTKVVFFFGPAVTKYSRGVVKVSQINRKLYQVLLSQCVSITK